MRYKQWARDRKGVLNGWWGQLLSRETIIHEQLGKWTFAVTMRGQAHIAHILVRSFDYYERRLHLRYDERPITVLVCLAHTTCVPLHVEVLDFPMSYAPYQLPAIYTPEKWGTVLGKQVLLGQLLTQTVKPDEALADFASSTRFAYLARMAHLLKPLPGRTPEL